MRYIPVGLHHKAMVDDEDFDLLKGMTWSISKGYAMNRTYSQNGLKIIFMHRFLMNTPKGNDTDHLNRNRLDNRKSNLRICTRRENLRNTRKRVYRPMTSQYKGVVFIPQRNKWRAVVADKKGRPQFIGYFSLERHAALACDLWNYDMFPQFAQMNFPIKYQNQG